MGVIGCAVSSDVISLLDRNLDVEKVQEYKCQILGNIN
jgi:hypothetical protein